MPRCCTGYDVGFDAADRGGVGTLTVIVGAVSVMMVSMMWWLLWCRFCDGYYGVESVTVIMVYIMWRLLRCRFCGGYYGVDYVAVIVVSTL